MSSLSPTQVQYMEAHIHDNKSKGIIVANVVCLTAAYLAVGLRFFARSLTKAGFGADDFWIGFALLLCTGQIISSSLTVRYGMGKHIILVTNTYGLATTVLAAECLYNATIPAIKVAILCLYNRIFPQRQFRYTLVYVGLFVIAYSVAQFFGDIFQCVPLEALWDPTVHKKCINIAAVIISGGVINIVTDFILLTLPMPLLWNLNVSKSKKRMLSAVFLVGGCTCIASIVRLFYAKGVNSTDSTYNTTGALITSSVEMSAGIISACIPTYRPLIHKIIHGHLSVGSLGWLSRRGQTDEEHIKMSSVATGSDKGWSAITEPKDLVEDEQVLRPIDRE
ncbi:hypothetical protein BDR22DRAFT_892817 [Usnea florida]